MVNPLNKEILCTLGPASMNDRVIGRLEELGVTLFRINLSHTKLADLSRIVDYLGSRTAVPVCFDTEGAQIRTGDLVADNVALRENSIVYSHRLPVPGDSQNFNLYPERIIEKLAVGDFLSIDFNAVLVQIVAKYDDRIAMRVLNGGVVGRNKAVTVERDIFLDTMTRKDRAALELGRKIGIRHVALSFANRGSDVDAVRAVCVPDVFLISKIECHAGLVNLDEIARKSDGLLIDRGDLSREEPLERIPLLQKTIIRRGKALGRKVYVATNLLESMVTSPKPTRAEVNDVINTLIDGADGLVLAAETAIGKDPVACVSMIVKLINEYAGYPSGNAFVTGTSRQSGATSLLTEPHGGVLIHREIKPEAAKALAFAERLAVPHSTLLDCQQIALGAFSPLTGFMDSDTLRSVLDTNRLPNGLPWTMPIVLQVHRQQAPSLSPGQRVALTDAQGTIYATVDVAEIFSHELGDLAAKWFGTRSPDHPGAAKLFKDGDRFVAGAVSLLRRPPSTHQQYEFTPDETRFIFTHKGWNKVVGLHTRNVIHRAHEHIQLAALEQTGADGLYLNPVIGPKKPGDFMPGPIIKSYQMMIDFGLYPQGKVVFGSFSTYPRYSGPREAVFTALCRKNMGCSHFIVGRDHAGVGNFYRDADYRALFDELDDLGITPVFFHNVGFNAATQRYSAADSEIDSLPISGTQLREALQRNESLPDWLMRDMIQDMLRAELSANQPLFCD